MIIPKMVYSVRAAAMRNAYRAVSTVRFREAVDVLHAFQKKSPSGIRTATRDVELVTQRFKIAQHYYEDHHGKSKR